MDSRSCLVALVIAVAGSVGCLADGDTGAAKGTSSDLTVRSEVRLEPGEYAEFTFDTDPGESLELGLTQKGEAREASLEVQEGSSDAALRRGTEIYYEFVPANRLDTVTIKVRVHNDGWPGQGGLLIGTLTGRAVRSGGALPTNTTIERLEVSEELLGETAKTRPEAKESLARRCNEWLGSLRTTMSASDGRVETFDCGAPTEKAWSDGPVSYSAAAKATVAFNVPVGMSVAMSNGPPVASPGNGSTYSYNTGLKAWRDACASYLSAQVHDNGEGLVLATCGTPKKVYSNVHILESTPSVWLVR